MGMKMTLILRNWLADNTYYIFSNNKIEKNFDQLVLQLQALDADTKLISYLLNNQIHRTVEYDKKLLNSSPLELSQSLEKRLSFLKHLLEACDLHQEASLTEKLTQYVISSPQLYPEYELANMLLEAKMPVEATYVSGYILLKDHVLNGICKELDKSLRDPADLSIDAQLKCTCDLCKTAGSFLKSKTENSCMYFCVS